MLQNTFKKSLNTKLITMFMIMSVTSKITANIPELCKKINEIILVNDVTQNMIDQTRFLKINTVIKATGSGNKDKGFTAVEEELSKIVSSYSFKMMARI